MKPSDCQDYPSAAGKRSEARPSLNSGVNRVHYERANKYAMHFLALAHMFLLLSLTPIANATLVISTWGGGTSGWSVDANWTSTPAGKPYPNNNATDTYEARLYSGLATLTETIVVDSLVLNGGSIAGDYGLTVNTAVGWQRGTMKATDPSAGTTTIGALATATISGIGSKILEGRTMDNLGLINWSGASVLLNNAAVLNNNGKFDVRSDGDVFNSTAGTAGTVNNSGTFLKSLGTGYSDVYDVTFNNSGTVQTDVGILRFLNNRLIAQDGSKFTGTGTTMVHSGSIFELAGATTIQNVQLYGKLTGSGTVWGEGFEWLGGSMDSSGTTTIGASATATISGVASKTLDGRRLDNQGLIKWSGASVLLNNAAVLNNKGKLDVRGDGDVFNNTAGTAGTVNNKGTFLKSLGTGYSDVYDVTFNNAGTVQTDVGILRFLNNRLIAQDGSKFTGAGTTMVHSGSIFELAGATTIQNVQLYGKLTGSGTVWGEGFEWLGGSMDNTGTTTIGALATATISGIASKTLDGRRLDNQGLIKWSGASVLLNNAAVLNNNGKLDVRGDGDVFNSTAGMAGTVNNSGTFLKSLGTGYSDVYDVTFNNAGTVQAEVGILRFLNGTYTQTAGTTRLVGGNLSANTTLNINGGSLTGAGTVTANVANRGIIAPGSSPGQMKIDGKLNLYDGARLDMELGGTTQGSEYDYLQVTSSTTLNGYLVVRFVNGFQNSIRGSDSFTLLTAASLSGAFDNVANGGRLLTEDGYGWFNVHYGSGTYAKMVVLDGFTAVPEPGTLLAGALALLGFTVQCSRWSRRT